MVRGRLGVLEQSGLGPAPFLQGPPQSLQRGDQLWPFLKHQIRVPKNLWSSLGWGDSRLLDQASHSSLGIP